MSTLNFLIDVHHTQTHTDTHRHTHTQTHTHTDTHHPLLYALFKYFAINISLNLINLIEFHLCYLPLLLNARFIIHRSVK